MLLVVVGCGMNGRENGQHQLSNQSIHTHTSRETTYCTLGTNENEKQRFVPYTFISSIGHNNPANMASCAFGCGGGGGVVE